MKHSIAATTLVLAFAFVGIVPGALADEHKGCSNASLQGSFGYTAVGALLPDAAPPPFAGPFGEVGRQTFDGKGNTTGAATLSANGNIQQVTLVGTYTVNPDCTGSMTLNVSPLGITAHADFVITRDGAEFHAISTDAGVVETRIYRKQFKGSGEDS